jgi:CheY-like chemotaxis protein
MAKILLVDDDEQIRDSFCEFLRILGHDVAVAENGNEALKYLAKNEVDLLLLDIIMPELDGIGVLMALHKEMNRPRIIAISGGSYKLDQDFVLSLAKKMRVDVVLTKPVSFEVLQEAITQVLGSTEE